MTKIKTSVSSNGDPKTKFLDRYEDIVISGVAGRFPDSDNVKHFQENLFNKVDLISGDYRRWKYDHPEIPQRTGKINNVNKFDAAFFGIDHMTAHTMDPMSRMLLEHTYEAIIDAGVNPRHLRGTRTGVFIGACFSESEKTWVYEKLKVKGYGFNACDRAMLANRISGWLGVRGPSYAIDTACSSSLFAIEHALRAIRSGQCDSAIVGAANLCLHPFVSLQFHRLGVLSDDGKSKAFDEAANGYVRSEAISAIYLQKAKDAKRIYGTLVHARTNCDGYKEQGITFPSSAIQTKLLQECYEECGIDCREVSYVEAHGTGTFVGDPEEVNTLETVFCKNRDTPILIGSVKSNMGHSESTSGLCSVVKVIIALHTGYIPPNLHYHNPRKCIEALHDGRIKVVSEKTEWKGNYLAVNSFGFGGANAHVVLKKNMKEKINNGLPQDDLPRLVAVSGCTKLAVDSLLTDIESRPVDAEHVSLLHDVHSEDICGHSYRGYTIIGGQNADRSSIKEIKYYSGTKKQTWFVFSGLGSQWPGMGEALLRFPVFAHAIHKCDTALKSYGVNIHDILTRKAENSFDDIIKTLVGITAVQIGLVDLLAHVGISPDYIIGYSVGELACAYADGCFTTEQTILLAYFCGLASVESDVNKGCMAIVGLGHSNLKKLCPPDIQVFCHDATDTASISGPTQSINTFLEKLKMNKIFVQEIPSCGIIYHSSIAPISKKLLDKMQKIIPHPKPRSCRWLSTSVPHNEWTTPAARIASAEYIVNNLSKPILLQETCSGIPKNAAVIEISPHAMLQTTLQRLTDPNVVNIPLMQSYHKDNTEMVLQALGQLYITGCQPQIQNLYPKIQYPVSRNTPMISPVIKWDHSEDWYVTKYDKNEKIASGERVIEVSLSDEDYEYMSGHTIDGRNLFPATGYLFLIWQTFGMMRDKLFNECPVVFENVKFQRATAIPAKGSIFLTLMVQKGSGKFEVVEGEAAVVSGSIHEVVDVPKKKINSPSMNDKEEDVIFSRDVYKEMRLRGYHYSGLFRGIKSATRVGSRGEIAWVDNWVAFMDNMLQLQILGTDSRGLFVPTGIRKLTIDPRAHLSQISTTVTGEKFFTVNVFKKFESIVSGGIEIEGLKASAISKRKPAGEPVLEEYKFVAHRDRAKVSLKEAVRLVTHIALENYLGVKIKTIEVVDSDENIVPEELTSHMILDVFGDIPLIQAEVTVAIDSKNIPEDDMPQNITIIDPSKLPTEANSLIAVGHNLFSKNKDDVMAHLLPALKDDGFLFTDESFDCKFSDSKWLKDLDIVLEKKTDSRLVLLLRKKNKKQKKALVIKVNNNEFSWVEEMKKILKAETNKGGTNDSTRIIFVGEGDFECGLLGLVNCLNKEPGGELVRGVLIQDPKAPKFSLQNPTYCKQLELDLMINVLREGGVWGSYRHTILPSLTNKPLYHACVNQSVRGDLSSLQWFEGWIPSDFKNENLIHVVYSSLNFKDVMLATGKLASEVAAVSRLQDCLIGFEYSGIDPKGRRIMGMENDSALTNLLQVSQKNLNWEIPDDWTLEDAATVPCVYATCCYALYLSGKMKKGDKILIHAGTGGIGQAAIYLALFEGCEIFTTVGTPEKRKFIQETFPQIPHSHIGNSRDISFEEMIMKETNGRGVDIVLNSLAEEKLLASVRCLARGGRFLEIGKYDLAANNPIGLNNFSRGISYHGVMLDNVMKGSEERKNQVKELFSTYLRNGAMKPLTRTVYSKNEMEAAFRYMAAGKHMGKVLIKVLDEKKPLNTPIIGFPRYHCRRGDSYLILGGLGGFGIELADWLVLRGAKNIVLTSRKGIKNGYQRMRVELWKSYGVKIEIITEKDASKREDCEYILKTTAKLGPIDGIFNLAVVLNDNLWENQTQESFQVSFTSKAWSTKYLDELSRKLCPNLRHFVVFSSVSCGRGNAGQTNYGMANSVMERICEKRAAAGLPALAVQWGAVGDVGLVAEMQEDHKELVIGGTLQQSISSCLTELEGFLLHDFPVVASMVVAEKRAGSGNASNIVEAVLNILGLKDLKAVSQQTALAELGMDSMMAVEIKQTLEREFEVYLTAQDIRSLNFAKLIQLSTQMNNEGKTDVEMESEPEVLNGMRLLVRTIGTDNMNSEAFFKLPSKEEKGLNKVFLIPGLEGYGSIFIPLAGKIKAPATCLQLSLNKDKDFSIQDMAKELLPHVLSENKGSKDFVLVGYSFGTLVTIELARILENKGLNGRLILVDGSPDLIRAIKDQQLSSHSEEELQNSVLMSVMNIVAPKLSSQITSKFEKYNSWDQKLDNLFALLPQNEMKLSLTTKKAICTAIYHRLRAVGTYDISNLPPIKSSIILMKPTQPTLLSISEDYGLGNITKGTVVIHYAEGNHVTVLESDKIAAAINGEKIQDE